LFRFLSRKNEIEKQLNSTIITDQKSNLSRPPKQKATNNFEAELPSLDFLARQSFSGGGIDSP
jgi:hypothetical protein